MSILANVKLNYPSAREWMWSYCIYLGSWTNSEGQVYDMGAFNNGNGYSAACVWGDEAGNYTSGELSIFTGEMYNELKRRLEVLELIPTIEKVNEAIVDNYSKVLKEIKQDRNKLLGDDLPEIEVEASDIPEDVVDKINSLDLRSDIENGNILGCVLRSSGYVGNRPMACDDEEHEDDTWAIDLILPEGDPDTAYLYTSKYEYKQDYNLLKEFA